jgi:hypothetical protein
MDLSPGEISVQHLRRSPTIVPVPSNSIEGNNEVESGLAALTTSSNQLLQAIKDLSHHGIDTDIPIPKIVMVGDQRFVLS